MFHNAEYLEASYIPGISEWMQDIMTGAWVAFARSGDPNHVGMPIWEPHTAEKGEIMIFDEQVGTRYDHDKELMEALPDKPLSFGGDREAKIVLGGGQMCIRDSVPDGRLAADGNNSRYGRCLEKTGYGQT